MSIPLNLDIESRHCKGLRANIPVLFQRDSSVPLVARGSFFGCSASSVVIEMETQDFSPVGFCFPFHRNLTEISDSLWASTKGIQTCTDEKDRLLRAQAPVARQSGCLSPASHSFARTQGHDIFLHLTDIKGMVRQSRSFFQSRPSLVRPLNTYSTNYESTCLSSQDILKGSKQIPPSFQLRNSLALYMDARCVLAGLGCKHMHSYLNDNQRAFPIFILLFSLLL